MWFVGTKIGSYPVHLTMPDGTTSEVGEVHVVTKREFNEKF